MSTRKKNPKPKEQPRWLDRPENVRKIILGFYGLCVSIILIDLVFSLGWHKHAAVGEEISLHSVEALPGFYGIYGFLACVGLVYISKVMRGWKEKNILMREEDYWEK